MTGHPAPGEARLRRQSHVNRPLLNLALSDKSCGLGAERGCEGGARGVLAVLDRGVVCSRPELLDLDEVQEIVRAEVLPIDQRELGRVDGENHNEAVLHVAVLVPGLSVNLEGELRSRRPLGSRFEPLSRVNAGIVRAVLD